MFLRPFENQGKSAPRHLAFQNTQGSDVNQRFALSIERMKVRRSVIAPEHLYQDSVERADGRMGRCSLSQ
jgi:hypothetical protein